MEDRDLGRSFDRQNRQEQSRAVVTGYGTTKQGQALARQYREQLADRIGADRAVARDKAVWRALRGIDDDELALRLLVAGISVCGSDQLGVDKDGTKNFRDQALWIGRQFDCVRELGFRVGAWGIKMLLALPVFDDGDVLTLTGDVNDFMDDVLARAVRNNPLISPLIWPPLPWTRVRRGGLPADHWAQGHVSLVRSLDRPTEAVVQRAISTGQMQPALDAVNYLQSAAFSINKPVLDFIRRLGPKPGADLSELSVWEMDMVTAEAMACCDRFFVPLNLDFRGRVFPIPTFHFQRADSIRGLFLFADGDSIGELGSVWLMAHVAACADGNTWSNDSKPSKLRPADRYRWTADNLQILREIGKAVLRGDDPKTLPPLPDDPCQFVAACAELVQARDMPGFLTRLPITVDASCSGLQHLCAMTRAEEGAYVNLSANKEPEDFYARIASAAWQSNPAIRSLMRDERDRAIVKQPAMSYFYGSRPGGFAKTKSGRWQPFGMTKQIISVLKDRGAKSTKGARDLAHTVNRVIEDMVPPAKDVRAYLEKITKLCADNGKSLRWRTPLGLPVINRYHEPDIRTISVSLNGRRRRVNLTVGDKPEIAKDKATDAVTANFIHSADACHLQMVALEAAKEGIPLVTVHDCFGTTAPHAVRLLDIVREQFVRLHKRHNLLAGVLASAKDDLPKHVELPPLPEIGNLNLEEVLVSHNAFK